MLQQPDAANEPDPARICSVMSNAVFLGFESHVQNLQSARERRREALAFKSVVEESAPDESSTKQTQDELDGLGVWMPGDQYQGDVNMRTLQKLLARVDARGFERCAHRKRTASAPLTLRARARVAGPRSSSSFTLCASALSALSARARARASDRPSALDQAFMKAAARVIYKNDWETERPMIMVQQHPERNARVRARARQRPFSFRSGTGGSGATARF